MNNVPCRFGDLLEYSMVKGCRQIIKEMMSFCYDIKSNAIYIIITIDYYLFYHTDKKKLVVISTCIVINLYKSYNDI